MQHTLAGKKVVVTGGNGGIGRAIALAFAAQGADVIITYHANTDSADNVLTELQQYPVKAKAIQLDLSTETGIDDFVKLSYQFLEDIDILVNNAGIATRNAFLELTSEEINRVIQVNLIAPCLLMQAFAKRMRAQQQNNSVIKDYCIINISSISRELITPGLSHYEASKAGLSQLSKSVAMDLAPYKIRVNDVAPGIIPTGINQDQWQINSPAWQERIAGVPLQRSGEPSEVAEAVLFLANNQWTTGTTLVIDGGRTCNWYGTIASS